MNETHFVNVIRFDGSDYCIGLKASIIEGAVLDSRRCICFGCTQLGLHFSIRPLAQSQWLENCKLVMNSWNGLPFITKCAHKWECLAPLYGNGHSLEQTDCSLWIVGNIIMWFISQFLGRFQLPLNSMNPPSLWLCINMGGGNVDIFGWFGHGCMTVCCSSKGRGGIQMRFGKGIENSDILCQLFFSGQWNLCSTIWPLAFQA